MPDKLTPLKKGAGGLGFRAFKLDSSNFKIWRSDKAPQPNNWRAVETVCRQRAGRAQRSRQVV